MATIQDTASQEFCSDVFCTGMGRPSSLGHMWTPGAGFAREESLMVISTTWTSSDAASPAAVALSTSGVMLCERFAVIVPQPPCPL